MHSQLTSLGGQQRNIRLRAILLHLQRQDRAINALPHSDQNALISPIIVETDERLEVRLSIQDRSGIDSLRVCYERLKKVEYMIT